MATSDSGLWQRWGRRHRRLTLTEAAQVRNIEAGVLLDNAFVAQSLREHFESLAQSGVL